MNLLETFADPELIKTMTMSAKLLAGLITTLLGMGITFTALIVLQFIIGFMDRFRTEPEPVIQATPQPTATPKPETSTEPAPTDDKEIIAAITAAIAMQLSTSVDNIIIRNIVKSADIMPAWSRAGIQDQMDNHF